MPKKISRGYALRAGRRSIMGQTYMVTTVTWQRQSLFHNLQLGRCVSRSICSSPYADTVAHVVMPDHFHWLFELKDRSLSEVVQRVKTESAKQINHTLNRPSAKVWQPGFHDHALRCDEDLRAAARYIIANPLRAGLVDDIGQYALWDAVYL